VFSVVNTGTTLKILHCSYKSWRVLILLVFFCFQSFSCFQCLCTNGKPAYVTIKIDNQKFAKTSEESNRVWNQTFQIQCAHPADSCITITLKTSHSSILGKFHIQAQQLLKKGGLINGLFPLLMDNGKPNPKLKLKFMLWFKPANLEPSWAKMLSNDWEFQGLKEASFPLRSNCQVKLYHDAHHSSSFQPPFDLCGAPKKLWEDVYKAIEGAKYLVYIAGWSFNPMTVLVRNCAEFSHDFLYLYEKLVKFLRIKLIQQ